MLTCCKIIRGRAPDRVLNLTEQQYIDKFLVTVAAAWNLGPSINGLVTGRNTKLCCRGFILALFQSTTANKIDSEHTRGYKRLFPVFEAEILRVTLKRIEVFPFFKLVSYEFQLKVPKIAKNGT